MFEHMFSKACEYGIRAVLYIANHGQTDTRLSIKEIAKGTDSPEPFTAKILQKLVKKKIISSQKGPTGGFYIEPDALQLSVNEIIKTIDGGEILQTCVLGLKYCSDAKPCPVHFEVKAHTNALRDVMKTKTIGQLAAGVAKGKSVLKRS
jgi:Rrf2 family iron-sulfur cluster assembly transcriptional regulator